MSFKLVTLHIATFAAAERLIPVTDRLRAHVAREGSHALLQLKRNTTPEQGLGLTEEEGSHAESNALLDSANLLMGTDSDSSFSRGNVLPIVARPFGFNHWAPQTV